jgi:hypothetical protein
MNQQRQRMSPLTAFFLGMFGLGAVSTACVSMIILYGIRVADSKTGQVLGFTSKMLSDLPEIIDGLPGAVGEVFDDRRAPEYADRIKIEASFQSDDDGKRTRPVLTVRNEGDKVVSMLAVRVAVLNDRRVPQCEWTEVVATPLAIDESWRGPLLPGSTRYVVLHSGYGCRGLSASETKNGATEISEIRIWEPKDKSQAELTASRNP